MIERDFSDYYYKQFLNEEKLMGSRCTKCGQLYLPPRALCIKCGSNKMEWVQMKGNGKLVAFTCIAVGHRFMMEEGYDRDHPYCTGVVELDEGVRIAGRVLGVDEKNPENVKIGTRLKLAYLHRGEGGSYCTSITFRPVTNTGS